MFERGDVCQCNRDRCLWRNVADFGLEDVRLLLKDESGSFALGLGSLISLNSLFLSLNDSNNFATTVFHFKATNSAVLVEGEAVDGLVGYLCVIVVKGLGESDAGDHVQNGRFDFDAGEGAWEVSLPPGLFGIGNIKVQARGVGEVGDVGAVHVSVM